MPSLADVKRDFPELAGRSDEEVIDAVRLALYPDLSREKVASAFGVKATAAPPRSRTTGEALADTGRSLMSGLAGVAKTGGDLYGIATGDMDNPVSSAARNAQESWQAGYSDPLKTKIQGRQAAIDASDGWMRKLGTAVKETLTDPALAAETVSSNLATMVPGMAAGRLVQGGMAARGAVQAARAGVGTAIGTGAVQQGADVASGAYDEAMAKTAAELEQNPDYVRRVSAGEAPRDVARSLGLSAARTAFLPAAAISVGANMVPGGATLERALVGGAARDTLKKGGLVRGVAKGMAGEGVQEGLEEGGGQFAANVALQQHVDPSQPLSKGVGENAGLGIAGGVLMGGPAGAFHRQPAPLAKTAGDVIREELQPEVGSGITARAVNSGIQEAALEADAALPPGLAAVDPATPRQANADQIAAIRTLPPDQQKEALYLLNLGKRQDVAGGVRRVAQNRLDLMLAAATPQDEQPGAPLEAAADEAPMPAAPAIPEVAAPKAGDEADAGLATEEARLREGEAQAAFQQREADRPATQPVALEPGDVVVERTGKPFASMRAAMRAQAAHPGSELIRVEGGLVVRPKKEPKREPVASATSSGAAVDAAPTAGQGDGNAVVGGADGDGRVVADVGRAVPDAAAAGPAVGAGPASGDESLKPKPTYASVPVKNAADIQGWAKSQGFGTTLDPSEMHVTTAYSREPIRGADVPPMPPIADIVGGTRTVERLGDQGAVVLKFDSPALHARWEQYRAAGGSWDYEHYQPHVTLTYKGDGLDLAKIKPYDGPISLGPEQQEVLADDKALPAEMSAQASAEPAVAASGRDQESVTQQPVVVSEVSPSAPSNARPLIKQSAARAQLKLTRPTVADVLKQKRELAAEKRRRAVPSKARKEALAFSRDAAADADEPSAEAAFRRSVDDPQDKRHLEVQELVGRITKKWGNAPSVTVVPHMGHESVPQAVRDEDAKQRAGGAAGEPEAFIHRGTVYLVSSGLRGDSDVVRALMHESLGHYGLRGTYGQELGTILDRIAILNAGKVRAKAKQYGLDFEKQKDRRAAAEEVLAEMAQTNPQLGWVQRAVAAIRNWMRERIPGYKSMMLSDDEIVQNYLLPARAFVTGQQPAQWQRTQGAFAPAASRDGDVAFSRTFDAARATVSDWTLPAGYKVGDWLSSGDGTKLSWWQKTVGTPYHLAKRSPTFARVYDALQAFINDTGRYANEAADLAPSILPSLDQIADIAKNPLSVQDAKALSRAVFEGTLLWTRDSQGNLVKVDDAKAAAATISTEDKAQQLFRDGHVSEAELKRWQATPLDIYDGAVRNRYEAKYLKGGVVFTDEELRSEFGMTGPQIGTYREALASVGRSLDTMSMAEMLRQAGRDVDAGQRRALMEASKQDIDAAALQLRDHLSGLASQQPDRADVLNGVADRVVQLADRVKELKAAGYFPLSRFGPYSLDVLDAEGNRLWFSLHEDQAERSKRTRELQADPDFAGASFNTGTVSQEKYKLFHGVTPETIELFGELLGLDPTNTDAKDTAFQDAIKLSQSTRSTAMRMLHRKGIAGYNDDASRTLAGFLVSNARKTASSLHMQDAQRAAAEIPKEQGEMADYATRMLEYVQNPNDEATALRGFIFAQQLAGSIASAAVNATQAFTTTWPRLAMDVGITEAGVQLKRALKLAAQDAKKATGDAALDAALKEHAAVLSPQEIHQIAGTARGQGLLRSGDGTVAGNSMAQAGNAYRKANLALGKVFSVAEQFNRRLTFIASYRAAVKKGMPDPGSYAAGIVAETQFTYNKGNKMVLGRTPVGAVVMTFKQFSVQYLELMGRMWNQGPEGKKAVLLAIAIVALMSGADGLPFAENVDDVIDGVLSHLGYNFQSKRARHAFFASIVGEDYAQLFERGISALPGIPIDVSGRFSIGKVVPGTGLLVKKADHTQDVAEIAGPVADIGKRALKAAGQAMQGDVIEAVTTMQATWARNLAKGVEMWGTGAYKDQRGNRVIDVTAAESIFKAIGFQPAAVARVQEASGQIIREVEFVKLMKGEMQAQMAKAIAEHDDEAKTAVRELRDAWNTRNPDTPITLNMPAAIRRAREMNATRAERVEQAAPKALRARVRDAYREAASS